MTWDTFRADLLANLNAPDGANNQLVLLAWAHQESGSDIMRWNNPLNTTQKEPGSHDSGAQSGPDDVQIYPDEPTGVRATFFTLTNGRYPHIVAHLQADDPTSAYRNAEAISEFNMWGTGGEWLSFVPDAPMPAPIPQEDFIMRDLLVRWPDGHLERFRISGTTIQHSFEDGGHQWSLWADLNDPYSTGFDRLVGWAFTFDGALEIHAVRSDGQSWHFRNNPDGTWQGWEIGD